MAPRHLTHPNRHTSGHFVPRYATFCIRCRHHLFPATQSMIKLKHSLPSPGRWKRQEHVENLQPGLLGRLNLESSDETSLPRIGSPRRRYAYGRLNGRDERGNRHDKCPFLAEGCCSDQGDPKFWVAVMLDGSMRRVFDFLQLMMGLGTDAAVHLMTGLERRNGCHGSLGVRGFQIVRRQEAAFAAMATSLSGLRGSVTDYCRPPVRGIVTRLLTMRPCLAPRVCDDCR